MMGYDSEYMSAWNDDTVQRSRASGRLVLTRVRRMAGQAGVMVVVPDRVQDQLAQLAEGIDFAAMMRPFSRCSRCNCNLRSVSPEDIKGRVPDYVYATQTEFARCPVCGRIYWPGTHLARTLERLKDITGAGEK